jgi:hypothetical protein
MNVSDICAIRTVGVNLSTRMRIVWRRGKASINRLLGTPPPETRIAHASTCRLPYEIIETIIANIAHNLDALKALSLTCRSWHTATAPHLHHTLTLANRGELRLLSKLHRLGLMSLIKEIRVAQFPDTWLVPQAFSRRDLRYFSAFANVQILRLENLEVSRFIPRIERYFSHFSPTLRSIMLLSPLCNPRQLLHFLSLFPNLDDITIWDFSTHTQNVAIPDTEVVPFSTPRLRGRLAIRGFDSVETWTCLIASGGSLQLHYLDLWRVGGCAPIMFEACAETLEKLRLYAADGSVGE